MKKGKFKIFNYLFLIFVSCIFILPIMLMIFSSLKNDEMQILSDMNSFKAFLPIGDIGIQNYLDVFDKLDVVHYFFNTFIITFTVVVLGVLVNSMLAYSLARLRLKGKKYVLSGIISLMIIPTEAIVIPLMLMANQMKLIDTVSIQIIPFIADSFSVFLFYQAFLKIPRELEEAAVMDGMNFFSIYWRLILPLSKPTIVSSFILTSLGRWGDVLWATLVTRGEAARPLAIAMQQLFTTQPQRWGDIFAFANIMTLPILIVFILLQKHFIASVSSSGVKG